MRAEGDLDKDPAAAKKALAEAKITLAEAVAIALEKVPGKAVSAELKAEKDELDFEVEILVDGKHKEVEIDAVTGKIEGVEDVSAEELKSEAEEVKAETAAAEAATTLAQAIAIAMKHVPEGRCLVAEPDFKKKTGKLVFEVGLLVDDKVKEVQIDGASGTVIKTKDK